jgi:hypothetical protein
VAKTKTNLDPWEKQDHETSKAYAAFCAYRDMGTDRSFAKIIPTVYGQIPLSKHRAKRSQLSEWSVKYGWVARVEAYDVYLEAKSRKEHELAIQKMVTEHAEAAVITRSKAMERIGLIGEDELNELTPKEALEYLKEAVKIERISRGAPDIIAEVTETKTVQIIDNIPSGKENAGRTKRPDSE